MQFKGKIEIDGKVREFEADALAIKLMAVRGQASEPEAQAMGTNVSETISMKGGILVTSTTVTDGDRTTTTTTTTNTNDGSQTTTTTTTDGSGTTTTTEINNK